MLHPLPARFPHLFGPVVLLALIASAASAQSYRNAPTKLNVHSDAPTLRLRQQTYLRVSLRDEQDAEVAAPSDTRLTLLASRHRDAEAARRDASGDAAHGNSLTMPADRDTVRASLLIPKGHAGLSLIFSSQRPGTIYIFAESEKLATGSTLVAVVGRRAGKRADATGRVRGDDDRRTRGDTASFDGGGDDNAVVFRRALFQEPADAPPLRLNINAEAAKPAPGGWERKVWVQLKEGDELVASEGKIEVILNVVEGEGVFEPRMVVIPHEGAMTGSPAILRTRGGDIKVSAEAVRRGASAVRSAHSTVAFPVAKRATQLIVESIPLEAIANGLTPIKVRVRAADDEKNTIYGADEGLEARDVTFRLEGKTLGVRFADNLTHVTIPKDAMAAEVVLFGSSPVFGTKVVAESSNGGGGAISGAGDIVFLFTWWQLTSAMLGGAAVSFSHRAIRLRGAQRGRARKLLRTIFDGMGGAVCGAILFLLLFFGAVGLKELNLNGIPITLASLPVQNSFAALLIGLLSGAATGLPDFIRTGVIDRARKVLAPAQPA